MEIEPSRAELSRVTVLVFTTAPTPLPMLRQPTESLTGDIVSVVPHLEETVISGTILPHTVRNPNM